jgi:drug/metabolite transporter (DMT)-like permease
MRFKANVLLLLAAAIWGLAFVAQRAGMDYVGPFTFNGVRFALGSVSLLPLIYFYRRRSQSDGEAAGRKDIKSWQAGCGAGLILFAGASLQQIGLVYTTAGKAAFVTCLYIVLVPIMGLFLKQRLTTGNWLGSGLAIAGLYLLCIKEGFTISYGDLLELIGAFFWTLHILFIDYFSRRTDTLELAFFQFVTCSVLSLVVALPVEVVTVQGLFQAGIPIL